MEINMKRIGKLTGAACAASGVVTVSALAASGAAVGAIVKGFKSASSTMKNILNEQKQDENTVVEQSPAASVETVAESVEKISNLLEGNKMSKYKLKSGKVGEAVVGTYKKIEDTVVGGYKKIEDAFVETFLEKVEDDSDESK